MAPIHWLAWCAAAVFVFLLYWLTRAHKPATRRPGHKHYCPVCEREFTCVKPHCTSDLLTEHPRCEASFRNRQDWAA